MILHDDLSRFFPAALYPVSKLKETVRRFQDGRIRTIVHRKRQFFRAKPVFQQEKHILSGSPPAVDHLIRVSDRKESHFRSSRLRPAAGAAQCLQELQLQPVAVLDFIHNDPFRMPSALPASVCSLTLPADIPQQFRAHSQQICKSHLILPFLLLLQKRIEQKQIILIPGLCLSSQVLLILLLHPLFQTIFILHFEPALRDDVQRQFQLLIRIHDRKLFRPSRCLHRQTVLQKAERHTVKRSESLHLLRCYAGLTTQ